ncbi:MAG: hypothetical protein ACUVTZ_15000 [Armatimonadota bacterium]
MLEEIRRRIAALYDVGRAVLAEGLTPAPPYASLLPLGLALLQLHDLFSILLNGSENELRQLFGAEEGPKPDLYIRVRAIHGLVIASDYPVNLKAEEGDLERANQILPDSVPTPREQWWYERIGPSCYSKDAETIIETARFLDDVLESALSIAESLQLILQYPAFERDLWREINSHLIHIEHHCQYDEESIGKCLWPRE